MAKENAQRMIDEWNIAITTRRDKRKELSGLEIEIDSVMTRIQWLMYGDNEDQVQKAKDKVRHLYKSKASIESELADIDADVALKDPPAREAWSYLIKEILA